MDRLIIHYGDINGWKEFEEEDSFLIHQVNEPEFITFYPYFDTGVDDKSYEDTVAVFKVARKWTNMMIADFLIETAIKKHVI